jgi:negative regulator of flagellin synthesis FlgM
MAIEEINKNRGINPPFKTQLKNSVAAEKSDFALTLSEVKPAVERRAIERTDSVVITDVITQIRRSVEMASPDSNVDAERAEKLARIKASIENGTYQINPQRIASNMMQEAILWG